MEITTALVLVAELVTPYRNLITLFLFLQYLQMRYLLDREGSVKVTASTLTLTRTLGLGTGDGVV